ncbi:methyl-CpG-binding domain protein 1b [Syngnathoides biaculeatus]|uniref:methyl-CpG-binding domain protein 1b n=1 Tax=Syngnathoides biaculeatus TaxID=300417 RepID=UPI002ADDA31D|nr:methyl-CpG-binding domain protein 1b [Syngnathoides biaculeatus]XP_061689312.1 methyl-CpG-binding domain protein 1b [Syngnathoides biaculeatus]XP_061689313.1 methyl-CpG-binding domain protein 1b [Syngnathoides biaculeatus]XP_061689314.1 methyl-CpG-binding domain protein 1b [Syngnathoides biaculeatus]
MDEEIQQPRGNQPVEKEASQSREKTNKFQDGHEHDLSGSPMLLHVGEARREESRTQEEKPPVGCPPTDWLEPLEEDDQGGGDDESVAGESEKSHSVKGSENALKTDRLVRRRRKRTHPDEGWFDFPGLGEGWKRKEVIRQSGSSVGQTDVYYLSPQGYRVRSRVELMTLLVGVNDISNFDYKSGKFYNGGVRKSRGRKKRKVRERSSSESSLMERGDEADMPDYHPKPPPIHWTKSFLSNDTPSQNESSESVVPSIKIKFRLPSSSKSHLSIKGQPGPDDKTLLCSKCGMPFIGTWYDRQRKRPSCPSCWASKTIEHPLIRLRKWIPCGQCVGCHMTVNCGQCANCKSPENRKRICRMRKCLCPIRKSTETESVIPKMPENDISELLDDNLSLQEEPTESQQQDVKSSETENISSNMDFEDDDDYSTDDDDDWHKKRKRRACGECNACLCRKDCGTCDFCVDKPKFGGSNKKRQKCRLRQCQRQAMRHLLPFEMSQGAYRSDDPSLPGRPRPHYTYSRKTNLKRNKLPPGCWDLSDDDDDFQDMNWSSEPLRNNANDINLMDQSKQLNRSILEDQEVAKRDGFQDNRSFQDQQKERDEEETHIETDYLRHIEEEDNDSELPMITQIFSLADNPVETMVDGDSQLLNLLSSLRCTSLPILWYAVMAKGPQIQLVQCSKQSNMSDTIVLIDPGFFYQVTVQKQPLLPTHSLYRKFPQKLTSVTEVVSLLLGLEKYALCQGLPPKGPLSSHAPITLERAATCEFLVKKNIDICFNCKFLCE